jgi:hypothetical protein
LVYGTLNTNRITVSMQMLKWNSINKETFQVPTIVTWKT